jgi:hypothetical protein
MLQTVRCVAVTRSNRGRISQVDVVPNRTGRLANL